MKVKTLVAGFARLAWSGPVRVNASLECSDARSVRRRFNLQTTKSIILAASVLANNFAGAAIQDAASIETSGKGGRPQPSHHRVSVKPLNLSRAPVTDELMAAGQLGGVLFPTHELKDKTRERAVHLSFGRAIEEWNKHEYPKAVAMFRKHAGDYPDSPWAAEAILHVGCDATYNGRYSEAEAIFTQLIQSCQGREHPGAKMLLNKARQRLALVKVEENNLEEAAELFRDLQQDSPDWRHRTYAAHWIQRLSGYAAAKQALLNCGADALAYVLEKEGRRDAAATVRMRIPQTMRGHSLQSLVNLAAENGYELVALQVASSELNRLPLPAILHVIPRHEGDKGHYWVLDKVEGDQVELFDPQSERRFRQTPAELAHEWTGNVLVFLNNAAPHEAPRNGAPASSRLKPESTPLAPPQTQSREHLGAPIPDNTTQPANSQPLPGRRLDLREMEENSGGCCGAPRPEDGQGDPGQNGDPGGQPDRDSCGSPRWSVNVINMNLFVTDTPLWHDPPIGPSVRITLSYNSQSAIAHNEPFGNKWQFNYGGYLVMDTSGTIIIFMPDGRRDVFSPDGTGGYRRPYQVFNTLTKLAGNHFELRFPDNTVYVYRIPSGTSSQQPFLVEIRDAYSNHLSFGYDANVQLTTITDAQNNVFTLSYNASGLCTNVADPFGRAASFEYDGNRNLTRITDMGGYWSSFTYDASVYLTSIGNERGTTGFQIELADGVPNGSNRYPPPGGHDVAGLPPHRHRRSWQRTGISLQRVRQLFLARFAARLCPLAESLREHVRLGDSQD